jgi:hypothetical protein
MKSPITPEREAEALRSYKWNFDGLIHEFNLLHTRTGHYINIGWMMLAGYIAVFGVTLANSGSRLLRPIACGFLIALAVSGLVSAVTSVSGVSQALMAIKRYIQNQGHIERELGKDHTFLTDVSLGRQPDPLGNYKEHESSLRFHRLLPWYLMVFWCVLLIFAVWLYFLPVPSGLKS